MASSEQEQAQRIGAGDTAGDLYDTGFSGVPDRSRVCPG